MSNTCPNFKIGDVMFKSDCSLLSKVKVARLTPRRAVLSDGSILRQSDGRRLGHGGWYNVSYHLPTKELQDKLDRQVFDSLIHDIIWQDQSLDTLRKVLALIGESLGG